MKDDEKIKMFFDEHKQKIEDDGFTGRLFATLDVLPEPKPRHEKSRLIIAIFGAVGALLFAFLGGYSALIEGLTQMGSIAADYKSATPEIIISIFFTACALVSLGRYAIRETE
jgi:hypothetical protein